MKTSDDQLGLTLCLDLSGPRHSLAFCRGPEILEEEAFITARRTTGPVYSTVHGFLLNHGLPSEILVGTGPGSYNGLRAALALVAGLQISTQAVVRGVSSLLILENAPAEPALVLGDARAGQLYLAIIQGPEFIESPILLSQADALDRATAFARSGSVFRVGESPTLSAWPPLHPRAALLPEAIRHQPDPGCDFPSPLYLKPPHIT